VRSRTDIFKHRFDLPEMAIFREYVAQQELEHRVKFASGDFFAIASKGGLA